MALRRGAKGAEEEAKKAKISFGRVEYFKLTDGDTITVRLIDGPDDWVYTNQHSFVPTKGAPPDADEATKKKWPQRMGAVCRRDEAFKDKYIDCCICDEMTNPNNKSGKYTAPVRLWGRMVIREAVTGTAAMVQEGLIDESKVGKVVGYRDEMVDEAETDKDGKETGKVIRRPKIVVANLSLDNFFGILEGFAEAYADEGGILNRDIVITRKGTDTDTTYQLTPKSPTPGFDLADPKTKQQYEEFAAQAHLSVEDLERLIEDLASDDFYARYFDVTKPFPASKKKSTDGGSAGGAPATQQAKPVEDAATQDALAAMRARVRGGNATPATETVTVGSGFTPSE
jgi:hypothetical protein